MEKIPNFKQNIKTMKTNSLKIIDKGYFFPDVLSTTGSFRKILSELPVITERRLMSALKCLVTALLFLNISFCMTAEQRRPLPNMKAAILKLRLDGNLTDSTGTHRLMRCNASGRSLSRISSPKFTDEGLLLTDPVTTDMKVPFFNDDTYGYHEGFSLVLRMCLPKGLKDYAPITLTGPKAGTEPVIPFVISNDSIRIYGVEKDSSEYRWWVNPLPVPDADGYTTIIYTPGTHSLDYVDRHYTTRYELPRGVRYDRAVINPADSVVLCDIMFFNREVFKDEVKELSGLPFRHYLKFGETDDAGSMRDEYSNAGERNKLWIICYIVMAIVVLAMRFRRKHIAAFVFMGQSWIVAGLAISVAVTWLFPIYFNVEVPYELPKLLTSIVAYVLIAWVPMDSEEYAEHLDELNADRKSKARQGADTKSSLGNWLGKIITFPFYMFYTAFTGAKREELTIRTSSGEVMKRESTVDAGAFMADFMGSLIPYMFFGGLLAAIVLLLSKIVLRYILPWAPVVFFALVLLKYIFLEFFPDKSEKRK